MRRRGYFDPFEEFMRMVSEVSGETAGTRRPGKVWYPGIDVYEIETGVIIVVELSGVKKENLEITMDGSLLKITGKRFEPVYNFVKCHHREILYGEFERVLKLPGDYDVDGIKAELKEGFLLIYLPGKESESKRIEVE